MPLIYNKATDFYIPDDAVYIGRHPRHMEENPFGNKFVMENESQRDWACDMFEKHQLPGLIASGKILELRGKDLICWCPPGKRCHGHSILRALAKIKEEENDSHSHT